MIEWVYTIRRQQNKGIGGLNMQNQDDLIRTYYEQAVASFTREASLLFERMNFFLAGMAFLVLAFVSLFVVDKWTHSILTFAIVVISLLLSALFVVTNLVAEAVVLKHRDSIYKFEKDLVPTGVKSGPYQYTLPELNPDKERGLYSGHPAIHTVIIPALFFVFWSVVLFYLSKSNWPALLVEAILVTVVVLEFICWQYRESKLKRH